SFEEMKIRAKERKFPFPYLYDGETQKPALAYGVLATPHVFIFDSARKLRYVGRIDDSEVKTVKSRDARNAIDALLKGKPVPVEKTRVFGCSTKWAEKQEDAKQALAKWDAEPVSLNPLDEAGLTKLVKNDTKKLLLVNVWATWCGPCVAELPEFVTMNRMYRRRPFQLVTISLDAADKDEATLKVSSRKARLGHELSSGHQGSRPFRGSARQRMAGTCALHVGDRAGRHSALSEEWIGGTAGRQTGDHWIFGPNLLKIETTNHSN